MIVTSLLPLLLLQYYCAIIAHYYIGYYYVLLQVHYYEILHDYDIIITASDCYIIITSL